MTTTEKAFTSAQMFCSQEISRVEEAMLVGSVGLAGSRGTSVLPSVEWEGSEKLTRRVGLPPLTGKPVMALKCSGEGGDDTGYKESSEPSLLLRLVCKTVASLVPIKA